MRVFQSGKASTLFVVLCTIIITTFCAVMIYIENLPSIEEKWIAEQEVTNAIARAESAQAHGMSVEAYEAKLATRNVINAHFKEIKNAIIQKDNASLMTAFTKLNSDFPNFNYNEFTGLLPYQAAVYNNNIDALKIVYESGVPCDYSSPAGKKNLSSLFINTAYHEYIDQLAELGCDLGFNEDPIPLLHKLLRSRRYSLLTKYPITEKNKEIMNQAFVNVMSEQQTNIALTLLENGIDPNLITGRKSKYYGNPILHASILYNEQDLAIALIEKGADVHLFAAPGRGGTPFDLAVKTGQLDIARKILEAYPDFLSNNKSIDRILKSVIALKKASDRYDALKMALDSGVVVDGLADKGVNLLRDSISKQDAAVTELLLKAGVSPNIPYKQRLPLEKAKRYKGEYAHKIVTILEEYEARSDYLALMRQQNGIGSIVDCQIGKEVNLSGINLQKLSALKNTEKPSRASKSNLEQKSCAISVALCTNQGVGVDDCVRSVATCSARSSSVYGFCCSASVKEQYNAARCSGLSVSETYSWLGKQ